MRHNDKSWPELDELLEPFLPEVSAENATAVAIEFRNRLVKLEQQVMSQYTAMAAYATIAKQDVATARAESRSDLDRSQATLIGLIEKLRSEFKYRLDMIERRSAGGDLSGDAGTRLGRVEHELVAIMTALQRSLDENHELRSQISELMENQMHENGWLVSTGSTETLSMR
jgi:hypothetical protein